VLSDFQAEDATLKGDSLWQVVEIVIAGVPTVLDVRLMCLFMSLGRILFQGSVLMNLFNPMRHQVDLRKLKSASYFLETCISWLIKSYQAFISHRFLDGVQFSAFVSSSTLCFFMSSVLRALALAFAFLQAHPSKKTSLKV
jgi:hypothetical protein